MIESKKQHKNKKNTTWETCPRKKWEREQIYKILKRRAEPLPIASIEKEIEKIFPTTLHRRTLNRRLSHLRKLGMIEVTGENINMEYYSVS